MQGRIQAILVASGFALLSLLIPPLNLLSSAAVALVTLRLGAREGGYVLGCACLASMFVGLVFPNFSFPIAYGLLLWLPIWLLAIILRESRQLFLAIEVITVFACGMVIAAYIYQPDLATTWKTLLNSLLEESVAQMSPDVPHPEVQRLLFGLYHYVITGLVAMMYQFTLLFTLFLARWWQAILYNPGGFQQEYLNLKAQPRLGFTTIVVLGSTVILSGVFLEIAWNITLVLLMLYTFIGTLVAHNLLAQRKMSRFSVPFLYITLLVVPHAALPIAIMGLTDTWLDWRNKFKNSTSV